MPVFDFIPTPIAGCFEIQPVVRYDERGHFVKTFYASEFSALNLEYDFIEEYYSSSHKGVIRGMHFQLPPHDHAKLVYCVSGSVLDVVLDLRSDSPTFGQYYSTEINSKNAKMLYVPKGLAHGFSSLEPESIMMYKVTSIYAPQHDTGIHWASFGFDWGIQNPVVSQRDQLLPIFDRNLNLFSKKVVHV